MTLQTLQALKRLTQRSLRALDCHRLLSNKLCATTTRSRRKNTDTYLRQGPGSQHGSRGRGGLNLHTQKSQHFMSRQCHEAKPQEGGRLKSAHTATPTHIVTTLCSYMRLNLKKGRLGSAHIATPTHGVNGYSCKPAFPPFSIARTF